MKKKTEETLLDIARRNLKAAKKLYAGADDEGELNIAAYLLEQAIELGLKHYIETELGEEYPYTHDIGTLLEIAGEETFPELYPWSGTITLMESKTRYIKNYRLSRRVIDDVMKLAERFLSALEPDGEKNAPEACEI